MSAIEMMDPKMDAGMVCNKSAKGPLTFQEAVNCGHLVLDRSAGSSFAAIFYLGMLGG
jgi:hypothetical protein